MPPAQVSGVVAEHVNPTKFIGRQLYGLFDFLLRADIDAASFSLSALLSDGSSGLFRALKVDIRDKDPSAFGGKATADGLTNPMSGTADNSDFILESSQVVVGGRLYEFQ